MPKPSGRIALEAIDKLTHGERRRGVDEQMQMVRLDRQMLDTAAKLFGFLCEKFFEPFCNVSNENRTPSARYTDEVVF